MGGYDFAGRANRGLQHGKAQFGLVEILVREAGAQFAPTQPVNNLQMARFGQRVDRCGGVAADMPGKCTAAAQASLRCAT